MFFGPAPSSSPPTTYTSPRDGSDLARRVVHRDRFRRLAHRTPERIHSPPAPFGRNRSTRSCGLRDPPRTLRRSLHPRPRPTDPRAGFRPRLRNADANTCPRPAKPDAEAQHHDTHRQPATRRAASAKRAGSERRPTTSRPCVPRSASRSSSPARATFPPTHSSPLAARPLSDPSLLASPTPRASHPRSLVTYLAGSVQH